MGFSTAHDSSSRKLLKAIVLTLVVIMAIGLLEFSPLKSYTRPDVIERFVRSAGFWGPAVFMLFSTAGLCLFLPGSILIGLGVTLFGPYLGFLYLWVAAIGASVLSFIISRTLGRDLVSTLIKRVEKYDDLIEQNGFTAVLYMRMMCLPFAPTNYGLGLSKVRFLDYLLGTAMGELVSIFVLAFFLGILKEIWVSGDWGQILSKKVVLSIGLVFVSVWTPKIIDRMKSRLRFPDRRVSRKQ